MGLTTAALTCCCDVSELRDLGVIVDSRLTFSAHINSIVSKAHLRANQILRCFLSRSPEILVKAFITYVRPILEYCSTVWNPHQITLINKVESVQRRFTKKIVGLSKMSYDERCKLLGLQRLELRRLHCDLVYCFNIIRGFSCLSAEDFFSLSDIEYTRGHTLKLKVPISRIDCRKYFFCCRIVNAWNSLSSDTVMVKDTNAFKNKLLSVDLSKFMSNRCFCVDS